MTIMIDRLKERYREAFRKIDAEKQALEEIGLHLIQAEVDRLYSIGVSVGDIVMVNGTQWDGSPAQPTKVVLSGIAVGYDAALVYSFNKIKKDGSKSHHKQYLNHRSDTTIISKCEG